MNEEILKTVREKGLLLEKEVFDLLGGFHDVRKAEEFLDDLERFSGQKMITKSVLSKNYEFVKEFVEKLPGEEKNVVEKVFVKMGLKLEIHKEREVVSVSKREKSIRELAREDYKVINGGAEVDKKLEVRDFVGHFRARYSELQRILMGREGLKDKLVSINKISSDRQSLGIIGIVTEKRITKNRNLIIKFEDLTGEIVGIAKEDNVEVFEKASELQLDDVVGIRASGNRDMLFIHDVIFPDAMIHEKTRFSGEKCIAFLSDVHCGSNKHLGENFKKFLKWINSDDEVAKKVEYLFFVGDNVDGIGIFPGQEDVLDLKSMEEQYALLGSYLREIPDRITIFMCPGQHDATRVAEPQPVIDKKYGAGLHEIGNLVLVENPCVVKLLESDKDGKEKEFKILMYHGASIHSFINEIKELRDMKAHRCPAKAVCHMLKRRHLAPMHGEVVYIPNSEKDPMVISEVPDVLCTGEVHKLDVENYNGVLIVTGSCWQAKTDYEEKVGNEPDPCKVPVLNLKTREFKVYDFGDESGGEGEGSGGEKDGGED